MIDLQPYTDLETLRFPKPGLEYVGAVLSYQRKLQLRFLMVHRLPAEVKINGDKVTVAITPAGKRRRVYMHQLAEMDDIEAFVIDALDRFASG